MLLAERTNGSTDDCQYAKNPRRSIPGLKANAETARERVFHQSTPACSRCTHFFIGSHLSQTQEEKEENKLWPWTSRFCLPKPCLMVGPGHLLEPHICSQGNAQNWLDLASFGNIGRAQTNNLSHTQSGHLHPLHTVLEGSFSGVVHEKRFNLAPPSTKKT